MVEKDLILKDLQEKLRSADDEKTKLILSEVIADLISGKYNIRVW
jgi:hypothetical protein